MIKNWIRPNSIKQIFYKATSSALIISFTFSSLPISAFASDYESFQDPALDPSTPVTSPELEPSLSTVTIGDDKDGGCFGSFYTAPLSEPSAEDLSSSGEEIAEGETQDSEQIIDTGGVVFTDTQNNSTESETQTWEPKAPLAEKIDPEESIQAYVDRYKRILQDALEAVGSNGFLIETDCSAGNECSVRVVNPNLVAASSGLFRSVSFNVHLEENPFAQLEGEYPLKIFPNPDSVFVQYATEYRGGTPDGSILFRGLQSLRDSAVLAQVIVQMTKLQVRKNLKRQEEIAVKLGEIGGGKFYIFRYDDSGADVIAVLDPIEEYMDSLRSRLGAAYAVKVEISGGDSINPDAFDISVIADSSVGFGRISDISFQAVEFGPVQPLNDTLKISYKNSSGQKVQVDAAMLREGLSQLPGAPDFFSALSKIVVTRNSESFYFTHEGIAWKIRTDGIGGWILSRDETYDYSAYLRKLQENFSPELYSITLTPLAATPDRVTAVIEAKSAVAGDFLKMTFEAVRSIHSNNAYEMTMTPDNFSIAYHQAPTASTNLTLALNAAQFLAHVKTLLAGNFIGVDILKALARIKMLQQDPTEYLLFLGPRFRLDGRYWMIRKDNALVKDPIQEYLDGMGLPAAATVLNIDPLDSNRGKVTVNNASRLTFEINIAVKSPLQVDLLMSSIKTNYAGMPSDSDAVIRSLWEGFLGFQIVQKLNNMPRMFSEIVVTKVVNSATNPEVSFDWNGEKWRVYVGAMGPEFENLGASVKKYVEDLRLALGSAYGVSLPDGIGVETSRVSVVRASPAAVGEFQQIIFEVAAKIVAGKSVVELTPNNLAVTYNQAPPVPVNGPVFLAAIKTIFGSGVTDAKIIQAMIRTKVLKQTSTDYMAGGMRFSLDGKYWMINRLTHALVKDPIQDYFDGLGFSNASLAIEIADPNRGKVTVTGSASTGMLSNMTFELTLAIKSPLEVTLANGTIKTVFNGFPAADATLRHLWVAVESFQIVQGFKNIPRMLSEILVTQVTPSGLNVQPEILFEWGGRRWRFYMGPAGPEFENMNLSYSKYVTDLQKVLGTGYSVMIASAIGGAGAKILIARTSPAGVGEFERMSFMLAPNGEKLVVDLNSIEVGYSQGPSLGIHSSRFGGYVKSLLNASAGDTDLFQAMFRIKFLKEISGMEYALGPRFQLDGKNWMMRRPDGLLVKDPMQTYLEELLPANFSIQLVLTPADPAHGKVTLLNPQATNGILKEANFEVVILAGNTLNINANLSSLKMTFPGFDGADAVIKSLWGGFQEFQRANSIKHLLSVFSEITLAQVSGSEILFDWGGKRWRVYNGPLGPAFEDFGASLIKYVSDLQASLGSGYKVTTENGYGASTILIANLASIKPAGDFEKMNFSIVIGQSGKWIPVLSTLNVTYSQITALGTKTARLVQLVAGMVSSVNQLDTVKALLQVKLMKQSAAELMNPDLGVRFKYGSNYWMMKQDGSLAKDPIQAFVEGFGIRPDFNLVLSINPANPSNATVSVTNPVLTKGAMAAMSFSVQFQATISTEVFTFVESSVRATYAGFPAINFAMLKAGVAQLPGHNDIFHSLADIVISKVTTNPAQISFMWHNQNWKIIPDLISGGWMLQPDTSIFLTNFQKELQAKLTNYSVALTEAPNNPDRATVTLTRKTTAPAGNLASLSFTLEHLGDTDQVFIPENTIKALYQNVRQFSELEGTVLYNGLVEISNSKSALEAISSMAQLVMLKMTPEELAAIGQRFRYSDGTYRLLKPDGAIVMDIFQEHINVLALDPAAYTIATQGSSAALNVNPLSPNMVSMTIKSTVPAALVPAGNLVAASYTVTTGIANADRQTISITTPVTLYATGNKTYFRPNNEMLLAGLRQMPGVSDPMQLLSRIQMISSTSSVIEFSYGGFRWKIVKDGNGWKLIKL